MSANAGKGNEESRLELEDLLKIVKELKQAGKTVPRIEELVKKLKQLQQGKNAVDEELCEARKCREALQKELDKLSAESFHLEEIYNKKKETLQLLQFQYKERENEIKRQLNHSEGCKQRVEQITSQIQEEKLKRRKQRMEFEMQLEELMEKHKSTWEFHNTESLKKEICNIENAKQQFLSEEKMLQQKLQNLEKEINSLRHAGVAFNEEDVFLRSQQAAVTKQLFEEENSQVKSFLQRASQRHFELQQKCNMLKAKLNFEGTNIGKNREEPEKKENTSTTRENQSDPPS
nr:PREDICTED: synaptonemal complex central element protein 1 isoform X2 [Latimeria chalumnae]|eukprot:XP_014347178.1 PREDICTED: synaptonemal complex central element protein 1 isoform X2 [Latimeria chalumnae]